jgi:transporter family protein
MIESVSNVYDRFIIKNELKNTDTLLVLWGYFAGIMFSAPALLTGSVSANTATILLGLASALLYLAAMHYYYRAVSSGEISRVVPILSVNPVIVLILATLFLGEVHEPVKYAGITLIMLGVLIHAYDREKQKLINKKALFWAVIAATFFAVKNILANYLALAASNPLNVLFWIGLGIFVFNIPVNIKLRKKLRIRKTREFPSVAMAAALAGSVTLIYTAAVVTGPVALVTFLHRIQILFVFIISELLDFLRPNLLHERFSKASFWQKLFGVIVVLAGSYLLI